MTKNVNDKDFDKALAEQPAQDDPCPGCRKGVVCRTPKCGRLKLPVDHPYRSEQPAQQEPVAWMHPANPTCVTTDPTAYARGIPLYTSPPAQRTWVGLTDEEWLSLGCKSVEEVRIGLAIQTKLKEKNEM